MEEDGGGGGGRRRRRRREEAETIGNATLSLFHRGEGRKSEVALSLQSRHVGGGRGSSSHTDRPSHLVARRSATSVFHAEKAFSDVRSCSVAAIPACNWRTRRGGTIQRHDCILSQSTDIKQSITLMICSG